MLEHVDLASIILASVFGVLLPWLFVASWKISQRTRVLEVQHEVFQKDLTKVEREVTGLSSVPAELNALNERCMTRCTTDREARERNDEAHKRIIENMQRAEAKIEAARTERVAQMDKLEERLVREFRKANGNSK